MITITETRNEKYSTETVITCEINHPEFGWVPYACDPSDHSGGVDNSKLYPLLKSKNIEPFSPPTEEEADIERSMEIRRIRDYKLSSEVDPIVSNSLRWSEAGEALQNRVKNYRASLLDITKQPGFPRLITWPKKDF